MVVSANHYFPDIAWCSHRSDRGICNRTINLHLVLILLEHWEKTEFPSGQHEVSHFVLLGFFRYEGGYISRECCVIGDTLLSVRLRPPLCKGKNTSL